MAQQGSGYQARYKRILLKLSGEALMGSEEFGIDPKVLDRMALEVGQLVGIGVQVGLVIGGGNLFRGAALSAAGMDRVTGDHMGMLATVMNALAKKAGAEIVSFTYFKVGEGIEKPVDNFAEEVAAQLAAAKQ